MAAIAICIGVMVWGGLWMRAHEANMVAEQKRVSNIVSEAFFAEMSRRESEQEFRETIEELEEMAREMEQEEAGADVDVERPRGGS